MTFPAFQPEFWPYLLGVGPNVASELWDAAFYHLLSGLLLRNSLLNYSSTENWQEFLSGYSNRCKHLPLGKPYARKGNKTPNRFLVLSAIYQTTCGFFSKSIKHCFLWKSTLFVSVERQIFTCLLWYSHLDLIFSLFNQFAEISLHEIYWYK